MWVKVQKFVLVLSADYGPVRWRTVICRFFAFGVHPIHNPRTPIRSFRATLDMSTVRCMTRRVATSEARPPTRHEQVQWIKYSVHEKRRFVYMTFFELDLNTLLHISQANLLYLHTPYTMGSQEIRLVLLNVLAVLNYTITVFLCPGHW